MAQQQQQQAQQLPPGALFRVPGMTATPRFVEETGPCTPGTSTTLQQSAAVNAPYQKFQTLDIDKGFLLELDFSTTYTNTGATLAVTPASIMAWNNLLQVQFESAYSTYRMPGFLGIPMQMYRSSFAPKNHVSPYFGSGANPSVGNALFSGFYPATSPLSTPNLALSTTTLQNYSLFLEVPVSMYFDLYYELDATGKPLGAPIPRAIVSPQRMAATTRNVTPRLTFAPGISSTPINPQLSGPMTKGSADVTSTFAGTVKSTWFRDAWIPSKNPLTEPPGRMWQYSRDFIAFQTSGGAQPPIPLDDEVPGQGQILSLIFVTYDPALNSGAGGITPYSAYSTVELLYGSTVQIFQDTPQSNLYRWGVAHGAILPNGYMGWDLMLTEDGRLTNENALNTLVTAGSQVRITYASGSVPSATATVFIGLEVLKKVGS